MLYALIIFAVNKKGSKCYTLHVGANFDTAYRTVRNNYYKVHLKG